MLSDIIKRKRTIGLRVPLIVMFFFCFHPVLTAECQERCFSTSQSCQVCFQECHSNLQALYSFKSCRKKHSVSPHSQNQSQTQGQIAYTYEECSQRCCSDIFSSLSVPGFSECQGTSDKSFKVIIVCIATLLVIVVSIIVIYNPCIRNKITSCLCNVESLQNSTPEIHPEVSLQHMEQLGNNNSDLKKTVSSLLEQGGSCAICLGYGCRVMTNCGHSFHLKCLWEWLRRKTECPLCSSTASNKVGLYCLTCNRYVKRITLSQLDRLKAMEMRHFTCQECLNKPLS